MAGAAADELRFLARELRNAGSRDVLAELRDGLKKAADPAAEDARRSILDVPVRHEAGLRRGIADTVKISTSLGATSAHVTISATGPDRWLGAAVELEGTSWSHPVFGNRKRWEKQLSPRPGWFMDAVGSRQGDFDKAVDQVVEKIERQLAGEA